MRPSRETFNNLKALECSEASCKLSLDGEFALRTFIMRLYTITTQRGYDSQANNNVVILQDLPALSRLKYRQPIS